MVEGGDGGYHNQVFNETSDLAQKNQIANNHK